jgi:hypothetical protein
VSNEKSNPSFSVGGNHGGIQKGLAGKRMGEFQETAVLSLENGRKTSYLSLSFK